MKIVNHANSTGFWCEFCEDYHTTIDCPHPANNDTDEVADLTDQIEALNDENATLQDIVDKIHSLADEWSIKHPELAGKLYEILAG